MRRSSAPTLQDVAREAGVSAMTVSVVLNGARSATRVSDATRVRIQEAAARLRYRPNAAARGLQRRRMESIGIVAVIDQGELNLYFLEVLNGILEGAAALGQNSTVFSIQDWAQDEQRILHFCDGRVDGMILMAPLLSPAFAGTLNHRTPFVSIHANAPTAEMWNLDVDNEGGAYQAVRYLIEQGHRRILHLAGPLNLVGAQSRLRGYRRALQEAGIPLEEALVREAGYSHWGGRTLMAQWLDEGLPAPAPTAIFCASDAIAVGCMETLAARGLRVPDDFSIAGFDDTLEARITLPPLTTVRQPFYQLGCRAVETLLQQIDADDAAIKREDEAKKEGAPRYHTVLDVELVVRASVAALPT